MIEISQADKRAIRQDLRLFNIYNKILIGPAVITLVDRMDYFYCLDEYPETKSLHYWTNGMNS